MKDPISAAARDALRQLADNNNDNDNARAAIRAAVHQAVWRTLRERHLVVEERPKCPELTDAARSFLEREEEAVALGVDIAEAARAWGIGSRELLALSFAAAWETL